MTFELDGDVVVAARSLLGAVLRRGPVAVRICEVEAYDGAVDPASHAYNGKTDRNFVMFGPAGHLYVYFTYGMHHACNVSAGPVGRGCGVLLRSGEVIAGHDEARQRRGSRIVDRDLARGPGRLAQALGITRADNGADLLHGGEIGLTPRIDPVTKINTGPRVGITKAVDLPWRFWIADSPYVSAYRPGVVRDRRRSAG
ncbi:DNA-3-methyladenine glycosylase [Microlunatus sp. Gsoil 973]|uniref:DNA-3-methyladenine glycosylase n=1 Tax=Microlunatus sp. Gsoil 973 TaxID=2672569 RepID=UPI0012B4DA4F|nr:DNA-3-methyladenine glycosylase [Microlunatus sp. Gsoil 973]QGN34684.1 DNA-3-methyladenine glycosylase [Microlunatus sp. Gsoil 973]